MPSSLIEDSIFTNVNFSEVNFVSTKIINSIFIMIQCLLKSKIKTVIL